ncbi:MAG: clostripain-related cysteine peptidase, partial [Hominimerdicola sp.]
MKKTEKIFKRVFAGVVATVLTATVLTGCSNDSSSSQAAVKKAIGGDSSAADSTVDDSSGSSAATTLNQPIDGIIDKTSSLESTGTVYSQTIMIYMVGSDLESEHGSASLDLTEMMNATVDTENNNILVYTGGASEWKLDGISADENTILRLSDGGFEKISTEEALNMGDADTLSSFINYGLTNYESDKYGLILWDHGSGPVLGYGYDENFEDLLNLQEIQASLNNSVGKQNKKLEWIGFDACLMSSLEVADIL